MEFRSFTGLASQYKRFIEGLFRIFHPIISLQRKGIKFEWNFDCEKSFQHLKALLTTTLILKIVDPNGDFMVCTYACREGLGGVLTKNGHVVCYESKDHEKNYVAHDRESAAIIHPLKMWIHYLMGHRFELQTYHYGLRHLFEQLNQNARQIRWLKLLAEYDFEIKYIKGKENKVANFLSQRVHLMHASTVSICKFSNNICNFLNNLPSQN